MGGEVYEDLGYGGPMEDRQVYKINKKVMMGPEIIRIKYIKGMNQGEIRRINREIAEDLIRRGYARMVNEHAI